MKRRELVLKRVFKLSKRNLFDAWTKPEIMCRWFFASRSRGASCTVENQFVTDGSFKLVMYDQDSECTISGNYIEIIRYNYLAFTWNSALASQTLVSLELRELSVNRTELTLRHQFLPSQEACDMHLQGWTVCLDNLQALETELESPVQCN